LKEIVRPRLAGEGDNAAANRYDWRVVINGDPSRTGRRGKPMSFKKAEAIFWAIVDSDDPELAEWVTEWCPWYVAPKYSSYEDGEEVRAAFREYGLEPTTVVSMSHSRVVSLAMEAARVADVSAAAAAFIIAATPDPANARFQNPLRAVSIIRNLPKHTFAGDTACDVCGAPKQSSWKPLNAASQFPGGYTGEDWEIFDNAMIVRWFNHAAPPTPTAKHLTMFRRVLKTISDAPGTATSVKVAALLKKEHKGHIDPWRYFFETLGYAGVLQTDAQPGNLQCWTNVGDRKQGGGRSEVPTPCRHWRREMGFNAEVFADLFPQIKLPASLRS
jgi:hypothetical protein